MKISRPVGYVVGIAVIAGAYFIGFAGRGGDNSDAAAIPATDPGYAARDAQVTETGYDGRERYRLNAKFIRQQPESGVIELEHLEMDYHPNQQGKVPGEPAASRPSARETWHLKSDHGLVRDDGDDVQLTGNVTVTGPAPGSDEPLTLTTESMRVNTPTEFIETDDPVRLSSAGNQLDAVGMEADLKAGKVRLKSGVHGSSAH